MANIGKVYKDSYMKDGNKIPTLILDIRTITVKKKFSITVNVFKWESGKVGVGPAASGKEDYPDYHIWYNINNRGESFPSEIVGNIKEAISENGLKYKKGSIFDPFVQKESIYFSLFPIDEDKKKDKDQLYNVVVNPYKKSTQQNQ